MTNIQEIREIVNIVIVVFVFIFELSFLCQLGRTFDRTMINFLPTKNSPKIPPREYSEKNVEAVAREATLLYGFALKDDLSWSSVSRPSD